MSGSERTPPAGIHLGRYGCPVCVERFESLAEKKRHMRDTHPKEKTR